MHYLLYWGGKAVLLLRLQALEANFEGGSPGVRLAGLEAKVLGVWRLLSSSPDSIGTSGGSPASARAGVRKTSIGKLLKSPNEWQGGLYLRSTIACTGLKPLQCVRADQSCQLLLYGI